MYTAREFRNRNDDEIGAERLGVVVVNEKFRFRNISSAVIQKLQRKPGARVVNPTHVAVFCYNNERFERLISPTGEKR